MIKLRPLHNRWIVRAGTGQISHSWLSTQDRRDWQSVVHRVHNQGETWRSGLTSPSMSTRVAFYSPVCTIITIRYPLQGALRSGHIVSPFSAQIPYKARWIMVSPTLFASQRFEMKIHFRLSLTYVRPKWRDVESDRGEFLQSAPGEHRQPVAIKLLLAVRPANSSGSPREPIAVAI